MSLPLTTLVSSATHAKSGPMGSTRLVLPFLKWRGELHKLLALVPFTQHFNICYVMESQFKFRHAGTMASIRGAAPI